MKFNPPNPSVQVNRLTSLFPNLKPGNVLERAKEMGDEGLLILPSFTSISGNYGHACHHALMALSWLLGRVYNAKLYMDRTYDSHIKRLWPTMGVVECPEFGITHNGHLFPLKIDCAKEESEIPLGFFGGIMMMIADPSMVIEGELGKVLNFPGSSVNINDDVHTAFAHTGEMLTIGLRRPLGDNPWHQYANVLHTKEVAVAA